MPVQTILGHAIINKLRLQTAFLIDEGTRRAWLYLNLPTVEAGSLTRIQKNLRAPCLAYWPHLLPSLDEANFSALSVLQTSLAETEACYIHLVVACDLPSQSTRQN